MADATRNGLDASDTVDVALAGQAMQLLAERALFWPARGRVFIADLHLGKADIFRRAGIALPSGGTRGDLERLAAVVARTGARSVCVLGDFLHGAVEDERWRAGWEVFRYAHRDVAIGVLAGNHDRALRRAGLDVELLGDAGEEGPFSLRHAPDPRAPGYVLCGHLHPSLPVAGLPGRWPAFLLQAGMCVLPAFSAFTGGRPPDPAGQEQVYACVRDWLVRVV